jgi:hypothetical protein
MVVRRAIEVLHTTLSPNLFGEHPSGGEFGCFEGVIGNYIIFGDFGDDGHGVCEISLKLSQAGFPPAPRPSQW